MSERRLPLIPLVAAAGRFRPTGRLARSALKAFRVHNLIPRFVTARLNGQLIDLDLDEDVDAKILLAFDERGLRLLRRLVHGMNCRTILDIGANIGNHTGHFCDWARQVYAYEPNPPTYTRLETFVQTNRIANVTTVPWGLSDRNGELTINLHPGSAGTATFEPSPQAETGGTVPVRRGDSVVAAMRIMNVDFIKIDVEGHEREVIIGLGETIARNEPLISMEFSEISIAKIGSLAALTELLPGYLFKSTGRNVASVLFKTALRVEPFQFGRRYDHLSRRAECRCWRNGLRTEYPSRQTSNTSGDQARNLPCPVRRGEWKEQVERKFLSDLFM